MSSTSLPFSVDCHIEFSVRNCLFVIISVIISFSWYYVFRVLHFAITHGSLQEFSLLWSIVCWTSSETTPEPYSQERVFQRLWKETFSRALLKKFTPKPHKLNCAPQHNLQYWGRILGRNPDNSLKSFPPCYSKSSHSFSLRLLFLKTHATSCSFFSALLYTVKEKGRKPDSKAHPLSMV